MYIFIYFTKIYFEGFPEPAIDKFLNVLIERGYKVARVEQTETPQAMEERVKNGIKISLIFFKVKPPFLKDLRFL